MKSKLSKVSKIQSINPWPWLRETKTNRRWWKGWLKRCLKLRRKNRNLNLLNNQNQSKSKNTRFQAIRYKIKLLQVYLTLQSNKSSEDMKRSFHHMIKNLKKKTSTLTFKVTQNRLKSKKAYKQVLMNR